MNTRLKQFLAAENITQAQFADTIKVVRASVSHVLSGRNNPGYDFIKAIMAAYPLLNVEWLILGKGRMYKDGSPDSIAETGLLFNDVEIHSAPHSPTDASSAEQHKPQPYVNNDENCETIPAMDTLVKPVQSVVKQRKISKILVLYDDGTFEEMGQ